LPNTPDLFSQADRSDPTAIGSDRQEPAAPRPSLDEDLSVLAWLQCSHQLSAGATGYVCDALLQWAMLGGPWPDPVEPVAGPGCDHLEALVQIAERLVRRAVVAQPLSRRFELARVGRELSNAIRCQRDPQALEDSQWRDVVHRMPWLAGPPPPVLLADGRVL
jgi:hypothetical protein